MHRLLLILVALALAGCNTSKPYYAGARFDALIDSVAIAHAQASVGDGASDGHWPLPQDSLFTSHRELWRPQSQGALLAPEETIDMILRDVRGTTAIEFPAPHGGGAVGNRAIAEGEEPERARYSDRTLLNYVDSRAEGVRRVHVSALMDLQLGRKRLLRELDTVEAEIRELGDQIAELGTSDPEDSERRRRHGLFNRLPELMIERLRREELSSELTKSRQNLIGSKYLVHGQIKEVDHRLLTEIETYRRYVLKQVAVANREFLRHVSTSSYSLPDDPSPETLRAAVEHLVSYDPRQAAPLPEPPSSAPTVSVPTTAEAPVEPARSSKGLEDAEGGAELPNESRTKVAPNVATEGFQTQGNVTGLRRSRNSSRVSAPPRQETGGVSGEGPYQPTVPNVFPLSVIDSGLAGYRWRVESSYHYHPGDIHGVWPLSKTYQGRTRLILHIYRSFLEREVGHLEVTVESEERVNDSYPWVSYETDFGDLLKASFLLSVQRYTEGLTER